MVPRAADLLLALLSAFLTVQSLEQLPRGLRQYPKLNDRHAESNSPYYPNRTGIALRPTEGLQHATPNSAPSYANTTANDSPTEQDSLAKSSFINGISGSAAITSSSISRSNTSEASEVQVHSLSMVQGYNSSAPTRVIVYKTSLVLSHSSYTEPIATYSPGTPMSTLNKTDIAPSAALGDLAHPGNVSGVAAPTGYMHASSWPSRIANVSRLMHATLPSGTIPSSKLSLLPTGHSELTRTVSAGSMTLFNPPRPTVCSGATLNIRNASLDYWYSKTYTMVDSTFLIEFNENATSTGWTLLPATDSFNVTSAIENPGCSSTTISDSSANQTVLQYSCSKTPPPLALATTTVEQTAYRSIETTSSTGDIPDVVTIPTSAAITITDNDGATTTYRAGHGSIVHFSQYEIVSKSSYRHWNGTVACVESSEVYDLPEPATFAYEGGTAANDSVAVGTLGKRNAALLQALGDANIQLPYGLALGTFVAESTVVVVVEKVVAAVASLKQGILAPAASLETPTATLPPGLSLVQTSPTKTGKIVVPLTVHVETSADTLDVPSKTTKNSPQSTNGSAFRVSGGDSTSQGDDGDSFVVLPFVAHVESSDITLAISVHPTQNIVTAQFSGRLVTATRTHEAFSANGGDISIGRVVSAISSATLPANALQVLTNAQATFTSYAAADAIAAGIGGKPSGNDNSGSSVRTSGLALIVGTSVFVGTRMGADLVIDGHTLSLGGTSTIIAGQVVALDTAGTAVVVGGSVIDIGRFPTVPSLTVGSSVLSISRVAEGIVVDGRTLSAGGSITIDGSIVSLNLAGTAVTLGGSSIDNPRQQNIGAAANIPILTIGTKTFTANAATQYNVDGVILTPGGSAVMAGTTLSLGSSAASILVNGKTQHLSAPAVTPAPLLTIGDKVYKPNPGSTYNIGGSSLLTPGGQVITSGTTLSLPSSGQSIIVNGIARSIGTGQSSAKDLATITAAPNLVVEGKMVTPNAGTSYLVSGRTLTPGGMITFHGAVGIETISLNIEANMLVTFVNSHTFSSYMGMVGAAPGGAPILTVDGQTFSATEYNVGSGPTYVVDGKKLAPGGIITIDGADGEETISLLPVGTAVVFGSNGETTTSEIEDAYGVTPTNAPVLAIGGKEFGAINNGATYLVGGQMLTPGEIDTVTIAGHTYIISLSPHATVLEIVEVGAHGQALSTVFETLFPATAAPATITGTNTINGVAATEGASLPSASATGHFAHYESAASIFLCFNLVGVILTLCALTVAFWL